MYKIPHYPRTQLKGAEKLEGERIETKVQRMLKNKEPIKDGAPLIYTERKDGILAAYNIRTDRWEVAAEAMDKIAMSKIAARESKPDAKVVDIQKDREPEPTHGKTGEDQSK